MARGEEPYADERMTIGEHLEVLRRRLIYALAGLAVGMGAALLFGRKLIWLLKRPFEQIMRELGLQPELKLLEVTAGFTTYLKISLVAGLVISSPWVFYQFWKFVSVGLYPRERRGVFWTTVASAALFIMGAAMFLLVLSRYVLHFFLAFSAWLGLEPVIRFQGYVGFMTTMMVVFGLGFQTPLVVLMLAKMGVVSVATLNHYRRHVIVGMFILAALLTSPSPIDQVMLAVPMWLLYELGVLLAYLSARKRRPEEDAAGPSEPAD